MMGWIRLRSQTDAPPYRSIAATAMANRPR